VYSFFIYLSTLVYIDILLGESTYRNFFSPNYHGIRAITQNPSLPTSNSSSPISLTEPSPSSVDVPTTDTILLMTAPTSPGDQPPPRQNSPRDCHPHVWYCASTNITYSPKFSLFVYVLYSLQKPKSYFMVIKSSEWKHAMNEALTAFQQIHTWDLIPLPPGANPVTCK